MVKKRKSSVANTPQRDGGNSKKVKVDEKAPDVDENNRRRSTRTAIKKQSDDAILPASSVNTAAPATNGKAKRTAAQGAVSKKLKRNESQIREADESGDETSSTRSTVSIKTNGESSEKVNGKSTKKVNGGSTEKVDGESTEKADDKSSKKVNGKPPKKESSADEELNLSEGESDDQSSVKSAAKNKKPKKSAGSLANGQSNKTASKTAGNAGKRKTGKSSKEPKKSAEDVDDGSENEDSAAADCRRSARKRVSRFSFKELVSSGSSEENSDLEDCLPKAKARSTKKVVSKKEMKAKIKQFIGDSGSEDDYKPDESEQSDEEEEIEEEEELSENESNAESDVSDALPRTSKYFKKKSSTSGSGGRGFVRMQSVNRSSNGAGSNLNRYQSNVKPKSGGCSYNSIGIDSLGTPQTDLLKNKLANCKVASLTAHVVTDRPCNQAEPQASAFGNGSCVRDLLSSTHITAKYEKYKRKHIAQTKNKETGGGKQDLLDILQEFETGIENSASPSNEADAASETDDDDFEEVANAQVGEDFEDYKPECLESGVTIQVKDNFNPRNKKNSKKNVDWIYDAIRQGINRQRREIYTNATKVAHLSCLARAKYLNDLSLDAEIQSLAYSIDFFKGIKVPKSINESFVKKFVAKFKESFEFVYKKDRSQLLTSREAIRKCFETGQTNHPTVYNLIFLVLFRGYCKQNSIEENSRLCIAFRPIDSKCDTLLAKPKKWQGPKKNGGDDFVSDDEKPAKKSTAKKGAKKGGKAIGKAAKGKSKKAKEESEEEEEDEDFSEGESKYFKGKKRPAKASSKSKADDVVVEKAMQLNKKSLIELWAEIYLADESVWNCVEPINEVYSAQPEELENNLWVKPLYVLAFNTAGHLKDLTPKYVSTYYLHKFKRLRLDDEWLDSVYSAYRPAEPSQDELDEDDLIKEYHLAKPLPKSNADFKNHGLYYLKKDQLKYEVIYPADAKPVGKFHSEPVFLRENVYETHSREYWKKEARMVRPDEEPAKVTTARPKWDRRLNEWIRDLPLDLYGYWQTEDWDPGEVVDGKVPRNEFGNVDLFKPCMLPRGAAYLRLNGLLRIAQRLEVDCVPAVTGFDLKQASTIPLLDGFVVPKEYEEILTIAWKEEQEKAIIKAEEKYYARVYGNWKRLYKAFVIHKHIQKKYRDDEEDEPIA